MVSDKFMRAITYTDSPEILGFLERDDKRFSSIQYNLKLNANVVDRRLKDLMEQGLVEKVRDGSGGHLYSLTDEGEKGLEMIRRLRELESEFESGP